VEIGAYLREELERNAGVHRDGERTSIEVLDGARLTNASKDVTVLPVLSLLAFPIPQPRGATCVMCGRVVVDARES
jgi:hypothetical protein